MPTLRVYGGSLTGVVGFPSLRVYGASVSGTVAATPTLRVYAGSLTGTVAVLLSPFAPRTDEPQEVITVTAVLGSGSATPDTWTWRQISGPTVALTGTGASRTFETPSAMPPGTSVTLGVSASSGGVASAEQTVTITVLPQLSWARVPGGQWVGSKRLI